MKKLFCFILALAMVLGLSACSGAPNEKMNADKENANTQQEQSSDVEDTATPTEKPVERDRWAIGYYVDSFQQKTEDGYIANRTFFTGTFSNSATQNSLLHVFVIVDDVDVSFVLYEYGGDNPVKNSSSRSKETYNIAMRTADGTEYSMTGKIYCGGDRVHVDDAYYDTIIDALSQPDSNVVFYIEEADRTVTNYLVTVETSNFAELYKKMA